jgi:hypothetical protein
MMAQNVLRMLVGGYRARRRYFTADARARAAVDQFTTSPEPFDRMLALWEWADAERTMAENTDGFRGHRDRAEEGFTLAASQDMRARLLGRVADTEAALWWCHDTDGDDHGGGDGGAVTAADRESFGVPVCYDLALLPLSDDADAVLAALETEPDLVARAGLVLAFFEAVVDLVGGQAAEVLAVVACSYFELSGLPFREAHRRVWTRRGESR